MNLHVQESLPSTREVDGFCCNTALDMSLKTDFSSVVCIFSFGDCRGEWFYTYQRTLQGKQIKSFACHENLDTHLNLDTILKQHSDAMGPMLEA